MCVDARRSGLLSLARFAFQACSFNHSDISPFKINNLRSHSDRDTADCDKTVIRLPQISKNIEVYGAHRVIVLEGQVANRVCVSVLPSGLTLLARFTFQACSIDHSDISPL